MIETKRLKLHCGSEEEMRAFIAVQTDDTLKSAYTQMLDGCLSHPDKWEFYGIWFIELSDGTHIGELCFKGVDENGTTEIGYGIGDGYRCLGYATEAVKAALKWAFSQNGVLRVSAEAEEDNAASIRVLEKSGFEKSGEFGEEGMIFYKTK